MIYDPLLGLKAQEVTADPLADSLVGETAQDQVHPADVRDQVVTNDETHLTVVEDVSRVVVDEESFDVTIQDEAVQVVVDTEQVVVVSAGEIGPPGPPGQQGLPGNPYTAVAPIEVDVQDLTIALAPGTVNGQGLIWSGSAWVNQLVVPSGVTGTVPYKSGAGFTGDDANFRYDPSQQALRVTKLDTALLDGGNF